MQARAAAAAGSTDAAARAYSRALDAAPDNAVVARHAFRGALQAGDVALADRAAAVLAAAGTTPADVALWQIARAAADGDRAAAQRAIAALRGPLALLRPSLAAWAASDRGEDAVAGLAAARGSALERRFAAETRALLLIADGRTGEGVAAVRALAGADQAGIDLTVAAAQLLAHRGQVAAARDLLAGPQPTYVGLRDRLGVGATPGLRFGVSRLFTRVAGELAGGDAADLSVALGRAALRVEPGNDRARLLLAGSLAAGGATARALAVLDEIGGDSPWAAAARAGHVQLLAEIGEEAGALAAAKALATGPLARLSDIQRYGNLLRDAGRPDDAAAVYRRIVARGRERDWQAWLQLGDALDRAGRWGEARPALERAVALAPDEPSVLNQLGYALLEHGGDRRRATELIVRADRLKPDDAAITDSLAWAYFLRGDHARAVPLLERAVAGTGSDDVTINEHLGDAYWAIGRRYEARYAWRAAQIAADAGERARLAAKIADGPPARR